MAGETTKTPTDRMIERLEKRQARRFQVGRMASTFSRLGVADPWAAAPSGDQGAAGLFAGSPHYAMLRRMFAADDAREKRFAWLFSRTTGSIGTRFATMRVRPTAHRLASSDMGGGDLQLVRAETQLPPVEVPAEEVAARPRQARTERRRDRSVRVTRAVRQLGLSRAVTPAPRAPIAEPILPRREPAERRAATRRPAALARPTRARADRKTAAMIASLEAVVRSIPYTQEAERVSALVADLREASPETWPARIREVVREIDATSAEIAAEVEASLPDELARPMTVAVSRAPAADEVRARGLRTVTSRSPMVRALQQEPAAKAHPASRVRAERLAGSRARTAGRSPRRVARSRGASVRRAAHRLGGVARAEAGGSSASADGPAPEPSAIELDRLSARGERRRMSAAARSVVDDAATVREISRVEPEVQAEQAAKAPRPRVVGSVSRAEPRARKVSSAHVASRLATNAGDHWIASAVRAPAARPARAQARRVISEQEAPQVLAARPSTDAREALAPVLERVLHRGDAPREIGLRPAFYQRLGVEAPAIATAPAPATPPRVAASRSVEVAGSSPVRRAAQVARAEVVGAPAAGIERLAVARVLRDAREQAFQAQHGEPRMRAASRSWPGESRAHRAPVLSVDAMNLPAAPTVERADEAAQEVAAPPRRARVAAERVVAMPAASDHGLVGRAPAARAVAAEPARRASAVSAPRAVVGRAVRAAPRSPLRAFSPRPAATLARPSAAVAQSPAIEPATPELQRETPRAADRAGARLEAVLTGASQVVRAIEKAAGGRVDAAVVARVSEAISAIEAAPLERGARAAAVRRALRSIGPVARLGEVESAAPAVASPVTIAGARAAEPAARLGLRPVLGSSPSMVAATPPQPVAAAEASSTPASEPSRRAPSRAPRLSASPVAGRATRAVAVAGATPAVRAPAQVASAPARALRAPSRAAASPVPEEAASAPSRATSAPSRAASAHVLDRLVAAEARQIVGALDEVGAPAATRAASRAELGQASGQSLLPRVAAGRPAPGRTTAARAVASERAESQPQRASLRARRAEPGRAVTSIPGAPTPVFASLPEAAPAEPGAEASAPRAVAPRGVAAAIAEATALRAGAPRGVAASVAEDRPVASRTVRAAVRAAERAHVGEPRSRSTLPEVTPHRAIEALKTRILRGSSASDMVLAAAATEAPAVETEVDARGASSRRVTRELAGAPTSARAARFEAPIAESRASVVAGPRALPAARTARAARSPSVVASVRALARLTDAPVLAAAAERALNATPEAQVALLREVATRGPAAYARADRGEDRGVATGRTRRLPVGPEGVLAQPAAVEAAQAAAQGAATASATRRAPALGRPLDWAGDRAAAAPSAQPRAGAATPTRAERGGGVVELLREARAVQELVRSLSRAPVGASRAARLGPVAAARLMSARNAETIAPRDAARMTRQILGDAFQVLAAGSSPEVSAAVEATPLSRVAIRGERTIDVASPRVSRRVLGDMVDALARAVAGAAEVAAERAETPAAGRRIMRPLAGAPETTAQARSTPSAAKRYVETPRRERRPALDEVYAAPFRGASEPEAAAGAATGRVAGARGRPRDLGRTLGAVEDGNPEAGLPIWAQRATGGTRVAGTSSGLLETLARAKEPGDVIRAIERGESSLRGPSKIPVPVLRLLDEIRAEAGQVADSEARAALEGATGQSLNTVSQDRGIRAAGPRSTSRVFHGYTNLAPAKQSAGVDGLGPDRLMKLVRRLQQLIFLADSQRDAAMRQVRLAEDSAAARSEGAAAPTQAGDARSKQVDIEALAHDVLDKVHEIQESRGQRRLDDPDNRSVWW